MGRPYWGQGYCTEACRSVIDFLFLAKTQSLESTKGVEGDSQTHGSDFEFHKIISRNLASNMASSRVVEKLGFQQEGFLKQDFLS